MTALARHASRVSVTAVFLLASLVTAQTDFEGLHCLAPPFDDRQTQRQEGIGALIDWLRSRLEPYAPLARILVEDPPEICLADRLLGAQG
jgi:hypothetical protein